MARQMKLLSGSLFDKAFMDSRIKTRTVSKKEEILGHLVGPLGLIFVVNTIAALVEKFFTQQTGAIYEQSNIEMVMQMGERYEVVMTAAKLLGTVCGLMNGWLIQHTQSRQGRMRPWYLIFGFSSIIIGCLIFLFPGTDLGGSYWYYFFFLLICYHTVGSLFFYEFRDNICSLTTRDPKEKTQVQFIRKVSWTLISGVIIGMLINMVLLPMWLEKDINGYPLLMICLSIAAIPLLLLEYFYTRERITEDVADEVGIERENNIPLMDQLRALLTNKYYVILTILTTCTGIVDSFKGGNVQYFYIKFLLDGMDNPLMYTVYQVATGIPLGLGAIIAYPIARKIGIRNFAIIGYSCILVGSGLGWLFPSNLPVAITAGFLRQAGLIPNSYVLATLLCFAFDSVEQKSRLRLEGLLGVAILGAIRSVILAPFAGGYESAILQLGFVDAGGLIPSDEVKNFMVMAFYLFDLVCAAVYLILLPFVDVEKKMPQINEELLRRRKEAVLSKGGEWIEPDELKRREHAALVARHEADRIADLKAHCQRKGLDFQEENQKYLARQAKKQAKASAKKSNQKHNGGDKS